MVRSKLFIMLIFIVTISQFASANEMNVVKQGRMLQKTGQYEKALKLYKNSLRKKPSVQVCIEAGSLLGKMHRYRSAESLLNVALKDFPENTSLMNLLALIKMRKGEKKDAISLWNKVIEFNPGNKFARKWLKKSSGKVIHNKGISTKNNSKTKKPTKEYIPSPEGVYKVSRALSKKEQEKLAVKLYKQMMDLDKWDVDEFIRLHKQVIEQCPDTAQAQESCWRLSNLYLMADDPPDFQAIIDVLEHLLKEYPDSPLMPDAKNRLLIAYQKNGQNDKVVELYDELFTKDPNPPDDKIFMARALEFAEALEKVGKTDEANKWYEKIVAKDNGRDMLEARVAKDRLANGR